MKNFHLKAKYKKARKAVYERTCPLALVGEYMCGKRYMDGKLSYTVTTIIVFAIDFAPSGLTKFDVFFITGLHPVLLNFGPSGLFLRYDILPQPHNPYFYTTSIAP